MMVVCPYICMQDVDSSILEHISSICAFFDMCSLMYCCLYCILFKTHHVLHFPIAFFQCVLSSLSCIHPYWHMVDLRLHLFHSTKHKLPCFPLSQVCVNQILTPTSIPRQRKVVEHPCLNNFKFLVLLLKILCFLFLPTLQLGLLLYLSLHQFHLLLIKLH